MEAVKKRTETTFSLSPPSEKRLFRINLLIEVAGEKMQGMIRGTYTEDQAKALITKLQKGR